MTLNTGRTSGSPGRWLIAVLVAVGVAVAGPTAAHAGEPETIHDLVNQSRWANGQAGLIRNPQLDAIAEAWASQLAAAGILSHNPDLQPQLPAGWLAAGENVAQGYGSGAEMHAGWMASPGHRANVLGDYTDIGIAFLSEGGTTWGVQVFAGYEGHVGPAPPVVEATPDPAPTAIVDPPPNPEAAPARSPTPDPSRSAAPSLAATSGSEAESLELSPPLAIAGALLVLAIGVAGAVGLRSMLSTESRPRNRRTESNITDS